ncbi:hypothetical protein [Phenylobacterium sp.]|uniref:hypothetical protein n=1 Tax=Phenylobacterium sp. TaxID=1871053 RepID=UPI00301E5E0B
MTPFALALALFAQDPAAAAEMAPAPAPAAAPAPEDRLPPGAPRDDYPFVAWCYGALRGYLDLHDEMMPEVTRIEKQFRKPGTRLEDDLKVYADMRRDGRARLQQFQAALTAAEKASVRPINATGAVAVRQGRQIWNTGPEVTKARKAQEWMSWALPARCETVSASLESRSNLIGATLRANQQEVRPSATDDSLQATVTPEPEPAASDPGGIAAPEGEAPAPESPVTESSGGPA